MARRANTQTDYDRILKEYAERYDVDNIVNPNDQANLASMIRNQLLVEKLQQRLDELADNKDFDSMELKKVLDGIKALQETNLQLEKQLGIDRKTRKQQQQESFPDYLAGIKKLSREFLNNDERLTRVYCNACQIMVGRISGVYDTTQYNAAFQCPQCKKFITITRKERDVFFDIKDANWRKKYPAEVIQAKRTKNAPALDIADDIVIGGEITEDLPYGDTPETN